MLWVIGAVVAFTILSFAAAIIASQIMRLVHGTPVQAALEERCQQSWYRVESWMGYHPLNQRVGHAMINFPAMPPEALRQQRALRVICGLQMLAFVAVIIPILAMVFQGR